MNSPFTSAQTLGLFITFLKEVCIYLIKTTLNILLLWNYEKLLFYKQSSKAFEQHLFELFCNTINVSSVTFDQFNASLLKSQFFKEKKTLATLNFWKVKLQV